MSCRRGLQGLTRGNRRTVAPAAKQRRTRSLHVEYTERRIKYGIHFIFSPVYEYSTIEYERVAVQYRVHRAEDIIHFPVAASQECVNIYSTYMTRRGAGRGPARVALRV